MLFSLAVPALLVGLPRVAPATDLERFFGPYQALLGRHLAEHELPDGGLMSAFDYREALGAAERPGQLAEQRRRLAGLRSGVRRFVTGSTPSKTSTRCSPKTPAGRWIHLCIWRAKAMCCA